MSGKATKHMIALLQISLMPVTYLTGKFQAPRRNFYDGKSIEMDIVRSGEDIAPVVTDMSTGSNFSSLKEFTNKEYTAPAFSEAVPIESQELINRQPGEDPFASPSYRAKLNKIVMRNMMPIVEKIRRSVELQASQIFQTGTLTLKNKAGVDAYTVDFKAKASHFPTAAIAWNLPATAVPYDNLEALAEQIRDDGLVDPDVLDFGMDAYTAFINSDQIKGMLDNRRIVIGNVQRSAKRGNGSTFRGTIDIGGYTFDMFTYNGRYRDTAGATQRYIDPGKVIMSTADARMDATFGNIPNIAQELGLSGAMDISRKIGLNRLRSSSSMVDVHPCAYVTPNGKTLYIEASSRPLLIPSEIDSFGCITTGA